MFLDRTDAGRQLGQRLWTRCFHRPLVLALPRGGVPVGYEVAKAIDAPLDVFVVRKLGVPGHEELAMGAVATRGVRVLSRELIDSLGISAAEIAEVTRRERLELRRRQERFGQPEHPPELRGRDVILVDDGLATGSTMLAAIAALRQLSPDRIVVALPVAARERCPAVAGEVDELVCLSQPESFYGVGDFYRDFRQTTDDEVVRLLAEARERSAAHP